MRPLLYAFNLFGLLCLSSLLHGDSSAEFDFSTTTISKEIVTKKSNRKSLFPSFHLLKNQHKNHQDYFKENTLASNTRTLIDVQKYLFEVDKKLRKPSRIWLVGNKKTTKYTIEFIVSKLNIGRLDKQEIGGILTFFGKKYAPPFRLCRMISQENGSLFLEHKETRCGGYDDFQLVDEISITSPYQKIQLRYENGSQTIVNASDLLKGIEEKDSLLLLQLSTIDALKKGQTARPHPFLDPLTMVYRSLRGDCNSWKADRSFTRCFTHEKIRWKSPDDNLVKYIVGLHLHGRSAKSKFRGGTLNYNDLVNFFSTDLIVRDYSYWSEHIYAFSNRVVFMPVGPDPNHPQLVVHRSEPTYQDSRTTIFDVTFSIIEDGEEKRIFLTGDPHENILMVSNSFADELGDNYLNAPEYTLSFEPMPSHLEWNNTIRVTNFGVFIHRGQSAKRYAGCKGITAVFDYDTMTMPIWESMRSLRLLQKIHDKNLIPNGNFWLKTNSYAPGATPQMPPVAMNNIEKNAWEVRNPWDVGTL